MLETNNISHAAVSISTPSNILQLQREVVVKLVTLHRCKYCKWECVRKVEHHENRVYHLLMFRTWILCRSGVDLATTDWYLSSMTLCDNLKLQEFYGKYSSVATSLCHNDNKQVDPADGMISYRQNAFCFKTPSTQYSSPQHTGKIGQLLVAAGQQ